MSNEQFSASTFVTNCGIGLVSGILTGGIGSIGSTLTTNLGVEASKKILCQLTTNVVSGAISSGAAKVISNTQLENKEWSDGFTGAILLGGIAGGTAMGCG